MAISMYSASVPIFSRMLGNLRGLLEKGAAYADGKKFDPTVLVNGRLAPDMYPLSRQIQIATDTAKGCAARLAGVEPPKYEDQEATLPELIARVDKTLAYLREFGPQQIDGSEERNIVLQFPNNRFEFKGQDYLLHFVLPNFYFHVTTAYAILRHNGVDIGKFDFLGRP
jgi:hypothetical protein